MHNDIKNYCETITHTAKIFEKKHTIVLLGILIIDGPHYFLELGRKLSTDKKTLQERLSHLKSLWIIDQCFEMHGKVKKSKYSITTKWEYFKKVMDELYYFGNKII